MWDGLINGLKDGVIDAIVSQHQPQEIEFKAVEFEIALYGMIGLQTALSLALKAGLNPAEAVEKLAIAPRRILGLTVPTINEGNEANLVLFDESEWLYNSTNNFSKSANSPFLNQQLKGKVWLTCNNNQVYISN